MNNNNTVRGFHKGCLRWPCMNNVITQFQSQKSVWLLRFENDLNLHPVHQWSFFDFMFLNFLLQSLQNETNVYAAFTECWHNRKKKSQSFRWFLFSLGDLFNVCCSVHQWFLAFWGDSRWTSPQIDGAALLFQGGHIKIKDLIQEVLCY